MSEKKLLVFVEEGLGNIIQTIPTLIAFNRIGYTVDIALRANYPGISNMLKIDEVNRVFNMYIEKIPEPKSYEKIILTMFGHLNHYRDWKEAFDGVDIVQDLEIAQLLGKMNDTEINMRFARDLGYEGEIPKIKVNHPDNSTFQYFDNIICPGSGGENKRWPYFSTLAKNLKGRVGIIGGPNEEKVNWPPNCVDMTGLLTLDEISAIVSKAGVYIGNDSGITHLANATGVPCVVVWGPTNLTKCRPWNNPIAIVTKEYPCQPCMLLQGETKCEKEKKPIACLEDIAVKEVLEAVEKIVYCVDYKDNDDYVNFWKGYKNVDDKRHEEILPEVKDLIECHGLSGQKCVDFGCGKGKYIPMLTHYYKEVVGVDITEYELPELNGVSFVKSKSGGNGVPIQGSKADLLFACNVLSWFPENGRHLWGDDDTPIQELSYKNVIIVDKFDTDGKSQTKKQVPLNLDKALSRFGTELVEKREVTTKNGEKFTVILGKRKEEAENDRVNQDTPE